MLKRIISLFLCLALLLGLAAPASAAGTDVEGSAFATIQNAVNAPPSTMYPHNSGSNVSSSANALPITGSYWEVPTPYMNYTGAGSLYYGTFSVPAVDFNVTELSGSISVYLSFIPMVRINNYTNVSVYSSSIPVLTGDLTYKNSLGQTGSGNLNISQFPSSGSASSGSGFWYFPQGYVIKSSTIADSLEPLSALSFDFDSNYFDYRVSVTRAWQGSVGFYVTSARVLTTETSADTEALEAMADAITQQTEIMQAFYGDIIAILQAMNTKLGSLEAAADLMNGYLAQIAESLLSIEAATTNIYTLLGIYLHYLESIAQTAEDIKSELASFHADFLTYIQLLISTVSSESDDIQAKMEEIYNLLIQYLNTAFGGAVTDEVTEGISGADNQLDAIEGIESEYTGSLSDKWNSIGISDFTIAPGLLSGVAWVSSWWTNFFEATGDFKVILTLGLFFGVCGLLIGMISRASRRAGGGDGDA